MRFCTYFDSRYLDKGLAMYHSLRRHLGRIDIWVLCLDSEVKLKLEKMRLAGLRTLSLETLEANDPQLEPCRKNRSLVEYYFTCTPCLARHMMLRDPTVDWVIYLDADLYFFKSPASIIEEMNKGDVAIISHRFSESQKALEIYGKFNVGWVGFRNNPEGIRCASWWRDRCLEWCHDSPEDGKFGDQKYLDHFHEITNTTISIENPGANLAPWNLGNHDITFRDGRVFVDECELVFFHFHDCKLAGERIFNIGLAKYGFVLNDVVRENIYIPYLRRLLKARRHGGSASMRFGEADIGKTESLNAVNLVSVPYSQIERIQAFFARTIRSCFKVTER